MKISPSAVLALAAVVATSTAFTPLSTPTRASVGVVDNAFRRPVSFLKSTETEEAASNAETYEYVLHALCLTTYYPQLTRF